MAMQIKPGSIALLAVLLLVVVFAGFLAAENTRMKAVLIEETLLRLEREYEEARTAEEANLASLKGSLEEAFAGLTQLRGLSGEEAQLIRTAISLTDEILQAATSEGISLE